MKKKFTIVIAIAMLSLTAKKSFAQIEEGDVLIEGYYGYSLAKSFWKSLEIDDSYNREYSGIGPIGGRLEYMISEKLSLGVDVNYRKFEFSQKYDWDNNTTYTTTHSSEQFRVMGRMNFHIVNDEKVDYYMGYGIGYKMSDKSTISDDPDDTNIDWPTFFPVAFRVSTGVRVFITDYLGLHADVGIGGGSFFNGGLTFKL